MKPLSDVKVLDLSRILAGPLVGQMLGDLGAEVIKIERPRRGDDGRGFGPPFLKTADGKDSPESTFYLSANRNKKSVTVDIATPAGQEIVRKFAVISDVLIENYKVGTLARYGLDKESLTKLNPKLIYLSITGFGQSGPYSHRPGYDAVFQGMGGLMSVNGEPDDVPGGGPMKVGPSIADVLSSLYATVGVLSALYHRDMHKAAGQGIDMALMDCVVASLSHYAQQYLVTGEPPMRRGTQGNGGVPSQMFRCADGAIMMTAGNSEQYVKFVEVLGRADLATDARFVTNSLRVQNRKVLSALLEELAMKWKMGDLLEALENAGVPAGPINDLRQVFEDPQVRHREMSVTAPHPMSGSLKLVGNPIKLSDTPIDRYDAPPLLGGNTREVLSASLGYTDNHLDELARSNVI